MGLMIKFSIYKMLKNVFIINYLLFHINNLYKNMYKSNVITFLINSINNKCSYLLFYVNEMITKSAENIIEFSETKHKLPILNTKDDSQFF